MSSLLSAVPVPPHVALALAANLMHQNSDTRWHPVADLLVGVMASRPSGHMPGVPCTCLTCKPDPACEIARVYLELSELAPEEPLYA